LSLQQRKQVLKCYWKSDNSVKVQNVWRRDIGRDPLSRLGITPLRDIFEERGTIKDVRKERSRPELSVRTKMWWQNSEVRHGNHHDDRRT